MAKYDVAIIGAGPLRTISRCAFASGQQAGGPSFRPGEGDLVQATAG